MKIVYLTFRAGWMWLQQEDCVVDPQSWMNIIRLCVWPSELNEHYKTVCLTLRAEWTLLWHKTVCLTLRAGWTWLWHTSHRDCMQRWTISAINYHGHCSVWSLWLSSALHTLLYSPLCFWYSKPPDFLYQTLCCWLLCLFVFLVHLHGMTFPFLSDRNPLWIHSSAT